MKVIIDGEAKEIAGLVVQVHGRRKNEVELSIDGTAIAKTAIDDMRKAISENTLRHTPWNPLRVSGTAKKSFPERAAIQFE